VIIMAVSLPTSTDVRKVREQQAEVVRTPLLAVLGVGDFAYEDRDGGKTLIQVSSPGACRARERLRLLVSAHILHDPRNEPRWRARWVTLGPDGSSIDVERIDPAEIDEAIRAVLDGS